MAHRHNWRTYAEEVCISCGDTRKEGLRTKQYNAGYNAALEDAAKVVEAEADKYLVNDTVEMLRIVADLIRELKKG